MEADALGEPLSADPCFVGSLKGVGKVCLHAVVDTDGSCAFGVLHVSRQPEGESVSAIGPRTRASVAVLHGNMPPFHRNPGLPLKAILTGNGRRLCGTERHPCGLCRDLKGIEHRRTKLRSPRTSSLAERSSGTARDEVFRVITRETSCETVEAVPAGLNARRIRYKAERPIWAAETRADNPSKPSSHSSCKNVRWTGNTNAFQRPRSALARCNSAAV